MNYFYVVQNFIEKSKRAKDLLELTTVFYDMIKKMGCSYFVCMSHVDALNPPDDAIVLTNYPLEWGQYHSEKLYHNFDPIQQTCKRQLTPFTWSDEAWRYMLNYDQVNMLNEAGEFGLIEGHTIPIHPPTGYAASLSVVFEPGKVSPEALNALHLCAFFLYEAAIQMKTNIVRLYTVRNKLTNRQRTILELIAQGKSSWDISILLSISESTVKDHVVKIFKKLNVKSRQQAIVKGLFYGDIRYMDIEVNPPPKSKDRSGFIHLKY